MASLRFIPVLMVTTESQQSKPCWEASRRGSHGMAGQAGAAAEALLQVIKQVVPGA